MKYKYFLFIVSIMVACSSKSTMIESNVNNATAIELNTEIEQEVKLNYLEFLPVNYDNKDDWPLLLFLHGAGERGTDIEKVAVHGPPKLAAKGELQEFIVVAPQCPEGDYWDTYQQQTNLIGLIAHLENDLKIDPNRIYVTGLSMGGFGSWHLAAAIPNKIAAAAPVCGGGNAWTSWLMRDVPIWAFHGALDDVVPLNYSEEMVESVNENGGNARLTIFPEANHNSWDPTYEETPELYDWLLQQNLKLRE